MKAKKLLASALLTFTTAPILAASDAPVPSLPEYFAEQPRKAPLSERAQEAFSGLSGFYITLKGGVNYILGNNITFSNILIPLVNDISGPNTSVTVGQIGGAVGYAFGNSGFDRVEIEYLNNGNFNYQETDIVNNVYDSSLKNQTLLLKGYYDINLESPLVPYLSLGLGAASNKLSTSSIIISDIGQLTGTDYSFAASVGLGLRWLITQTFIVSIGYDFQYLGQYKKSRTLAEGVEASKAESNSLFGNAITASFTIQFNS